MSTARRTTLPANGGAHAGLILSRYMDHAPDSSDYQSSKGRVKQDLINRAIAAVNDPGLLSLYDQAFKRWKHEVENDPHRCLTGQFKADSRLVIGLGGTNVTETGLTLHHVYGVPYLPGSALKGLAARFARQVIDSAQADPAPAGSTFTCDHYAAMFGNTNEGGLIHFHDGWLLPDSVNTCLLRDVMTPHHRDYYMAEPGRVQEPSDFDQPIPVAMLSMQGTFQVAVTARHRDMTDIWQQTAMKFLSSGLKQMGIGAKTSSGYGRMSVVKPPATSVSETFTAKLTTKSKSGNWKARLQDGTDRAGTITNSAKLPRPKAGDIVPVRISLANDPQNLQLEYIPAPRQ